MALAFRPLHRVHHLRDLLHGAHDAGGPSPTGRAAAHHVVDEVADGIARGGSYSRDRPRHAAHHCAHRAPDRAEGVAEDAAELAHEDRHEVYGLLRSGRGKIRNLVRLASDLVAHLVGELLHEAAGRTGAGLRADGAHDAADDPANTRAGAHGLLGRPGLPIAVRRRARALRGITNQAGEGPCAPRAEPDRHHLAGCEAHHRRGRTLAETGGEPAHLELEIEHPAERCPARGEAGEGNRARIEGQLGTIDGALHQELAVEVVAGSEGSARISHGHLQSGMRERARCDAPDFGPPRLTARPGARAIVPPASAHSQDAGRRVRRGA